MTVPGYESFMLPTLRVLADGRPRATRDAAAAAAALMGLSGDDLLVTIASGQLTYLNRAQWAQTYLFQAALITRPRRGVIAITDEGRAAVSSGVDKIDADDLGRYPKFQDFLARKGTRVRHTGAAPAPAAVMANATASVSDSTPEDLMAVAENDNRASVESEVLARVLELSPAAFERLIIQLLTAMGYGTSDTSEHTGKIGDGGIDGLIRQDPLGLDRIYMQAKRYSAENPVDRPAIQAFVGALHGQQADRGVFITTSTAAKPSSTRASCANASCSSTAASSHASWS